MAKIIVKSSYYKPNSERSAAGFIRYISTRDGVEKIDESKKYLPAAKKTQQIISRLLSENPQLVQLPLYLVRFILNTSITPHGKTRTTCSCILRRKTRSISAAERTMSATLHSVPTWSWSMKIIRTACLPTTASPLS